MLCVRLWFYCRFMLRSIESIWSWIIMILLFFLSAYVYLGVFVCLCDLRLFFYYFLFVEFIRRIVYWLRWWGRWCLFIYRRKRFWIVRCLVVLLLGFFILTLIMLSRVCLRSVRYWLFLCWIFWLRICIRRWTM